MVLQTPKTAPDSQVVSRQVRVADDAELLSPRVHYVGTGRREGIVTRGLNAGEKDGRSLPAAQVSGSGRPSERS